MEVCCCESASKVAQGRLLEILSRRQQQQQQQWCAEFVSWGWECSSRAAVGVFHLITPHPAHPATPEQHYFCVVFLHYPLGEKRAHGPVIAVEQVRGRAQRGRLSNASDVQA